MLGLNIQLHSFEFFNGLVESNDTIRVSITTLPDGQKQARTFEVSKMYSAHPSFNVGFSELTEKIVIVFRKKSMLSNDPIIASTVINSYEFPQMFKELNDLEMKKIDIYEPIQTASKNNNYKKTGNRKVVGRMEIQLKLLEHFVCQNNYANTKVNQKYVGKDFAKMTSSIADQSCQQSLLFTDLISS